MSHVSGANCASRFEGPTRWAIVPGAVLFYIYHLWCGRYRRISYVHHTCSWASWPPFPRRTLFKCVGGVNYRGALVHCEILIPSPLFKLYMDLALDKLNLKLSIKNCKNFFKTIKSVMKYFVYMNLKG